VNCGFFLTKKCKKLANFGIVERGNLLKLKNINCGIFSLNLNLDKLKSMKIEIKKKTETKIVEKSKD
jgi:hypothetical protein